MQTGKVNSHIGKRLEEHLLRTFTLAQKMAAASDLSIGEKEKGAILLHDLAKAHPHFQNKLAGERQRFNHAAPSALAAFLATRSLLAAEAVRRHHTSLENLVDIKRYWGSQKYKEVQKVLKKLPWWEGAASICNALALEICSWMELLPDEEDWDDLLFNAVELYEPGGGGGEGKNNGSSNGKGELDWLNLRLLYSLMVTADRLEAMGGDIEYAPLSVDKKRIQEYVASLKSRKLSDWRESIRQEVVNKAAQIINGPGIYTLTLPTGAGKTITGLQVAAEAALRLQAKSIIYVLPFISLVEQNAGVASKLFPIVREDHYFSPINEETDDLLQENGDEEADGAQKRLKRFLAFFRYWQEPMIVTTMAKLWNVLFSPRANEAMSFHRLSRAVILLDEPQSIPATYWSGVGQTLEMLSKQLGSVFILMTATQPEIAKGIELTSTSVSFPSIRHEFHWLNRRLSISEMAELLVEKGFLEGSSLIVLNTRMAALRMYQEMKKFGAEPFFLSAWLTPQHRKRVLKRLKEKEARKEPRCLISTQVIEAGIDLDFAKVFRDLGPFDSIIQVAGRCNRHGGEERGQVYIAELIDENGRSFASYVYDAVLLNQTRQVLKERFNEKECPALVGSYFKALQESVRTSELWDNIQEGRWGEYLDLYPEIRPDEVMLVVPGIVDNQDEIESEKHNGINKEGKADEKTKKLLEIICSAYAQEEIQKDQDDEDAEEIKKSAAKDPFIMVEQRRAAYREITRHAISVPKKYLDEWYQREGGMIFGGEEEAPLRELFPHLWLLEKEGLGRIYTLETGFMPIEMANPAELEKEEGEGDS